MSYISGAFKTPVLLPNGKEASSMQELEAYLNQAGLAMASDYSKSYIRQKQAERFLQEKQELFDDFLTNYKRMIFS
ncbi:MAG: hypothetical protein J6V53_04110 [Alphaproteobacteria bacterium]|nr:hypothetical protein [Alphaproteobacteria bacterium]